MSVVSSLLLEYIKTHKGQAVLTAFFIVSTPLIDVLLPHLYGKVVETIEKKAFRTSPFIWVFAMLTALNVLMFLSNAHDATVLPDMENFFKNKVFDMLLQRYQHDHDGIQAGDVVAKFAKLPVLLSDVVGATMSYWFPYVVSFMASVAYFAYHDKVLALCVFLALLVFCVLVFRSPETCKHTSVNRDRADNAASEHLLDVLNNLASVYAANKESKEKQTFMHIGAIYKSWYRKAIRCSIQTELMILPLIVVVIGIFMMRCYTKLRSGAMKTSTFVSLFMITMYLVTSMSYMLNGTKSLIMDWGIVANSASLLQPEPTHACGGGDVAAKPPEDDDVILHMSDIRVTFPSRNTPSLTDVTLTIRAKERIAIVGSNGSGKSTLLKVLMKYLCPTQGQVYLHNTSYASLSSADIARHIGYIPQQAILFDRTVYDNIVYGSKQPQTKERVMAFAKAIGVDAFLLDMAQGLDTRVGRNGFLLSGGQRQIVWMMRMLLQERDIIFMDEPTSAMDEKTKAWMVTLMKNSRMKDKTIVVVTHDLSLLTFATRVITMAQGRIVGSAHTPTVSTVETGDEQRHGLVA